jgi:hypothetical protein
VPLPGGPSRWSGRLRSRPSVPGPHDLAPRPPRRSGRHDPGGDVTVRPRVTRSGTGSASPWGWPARAAPSAVPVTPR